MASWVCRPGLVPSWLGVSVSCASVYCVSRCSSRPSKSFARALLRYMPRYEAGSVFSLFPPLYIGCMRESSHALGCTSWSHSELNKSCRSPVKTSPLPVSILLVMPSGPGLLSLFRARMASWVSFRWKGSTKSGSMGAVAGRFRVSSVSIRLASASSYGDSLCPWRGWLRAKRYWCQARGSRVRGPSFHMRGSLEAFSLTSLGSEDWTWSFLYRFR